MPKPATNPRFVQFHKDMQALAKKLAQEQDQKQPPKK